jgi:hypothetical protein
MNRAVHPSAAEQAGVCSVDDRVSFCVPRDVPQVQRDTQSETWHFSAETCAQMSSAEENFVSIGGETRYGPRLVFPSPARQAR